MTLRCRSIIVAPLLALGVPLAFGQLTAELAGPLLASPDKAARTSLCVAAEGWQVVRGGQATGGAWNAFLGLAVELDGPAWGGPAGGTLVAEVNGVANQHGENTFAARTGAFHPVSNYHAADHVRVYNLHYRHTGPGGHWALKVGQLALDDDFMASDYTGLFTNAAFGPLATQTGTPLGARSRHGVAWAIYPAAAPGVWFEYHPSPTVAWQTGVYHGGPGPDDADNIGFTYDALSEAGVALYSELRWAYRLAGRGWTTRVGVAAHTGQFDDFEAGVAGRDDTEVRGLHSVYLVQDVVLVAAGDGAPKLGAFGRFGVSPQCDRSAVTTYGDAGFNWFGPLPGRADDVAGIAVAVTRFGRSFQALNGLARTETALELTYCAHLTSRLALQADAQWLFAPAVNPGSGRRETAFVAGLRTSWNF
ncbi:carbohydrate porin [Opitutus sp. ER46]|uniref:carbohydrate porin n=1 Tax=Opitutus sp. ER46 TaxID=2161864 RepID=UPI000D2F79AC|nr:carbohydrate porin [Opitutus sp. ER46]PTX98640.1 hypothetical protein DB354_05090 [Opitutus sp. ER46]